MVNNAKYNFLLLYLPLLFQKLFVAFVYIPRRETTAAILVNAVKLSSKYHKRVSETD